MISKNQIEKTINKIASELGENVCVDKILKSQYV